MIGFIGTDWIGICDRIASESAGAWVAQQARNLAWKLQDGGLKVKFLLRDRDAKFSAAFDEIFRSEGVRVIRLPYQRPVANSIAERFVGTCRREALDHLLIFGRGAPGEGAG